jgi:RecA/RadA recombinase
MARKIRDSVSAERPRSDINSLLSDIEADLGGQGVVIQRGKHLIGRFDLRRRCGIPSLDIATGGGLPPGLCQIDGPEGTGKNLLVYHYFARVQQVYKQKTRIFMLCMEFPFDKMFAHKIGFRVPFSDAEIEIEQRRRKEKNESPLTKKEIEALQDDTNLGEFVLLRGPAEGNLEAVVRLIADNSFQIGAIDSWDAMLTASEEETPLDDDPRIANPANVQTRWMRKVHAAMAPIKTCPLCWNRNLEFKKLGAGSYTYYCECGWKGKEPYMEENETTIIGIRQVRANLNRASMRSREWKVGGANALKHGKLVDIQLRPGEHIKDKDGNKIGKEIVWEITKGKAGTHEGKTGAFKYYFDPPAVDIDLDMFAWCLNEGIISRAGGTYTVDPQDLGKEPYKFRGQGEVLEALASDQQFKDILWKLMLRKADLTHIRER